MYMADTTPCSVLRGSTNQLNTYVPPLWYRHLLHKHSRNFSGRLNNFNCKCSHSGCPIDPTFLLAERTHVGGFVMMLCFMTWTFHGWKLLPANSLSFIYYSCSRTMKVFKTGQLLKLPANWKWNTIEVSRSSKCSNEAHLFKIITVSQPLPLRRMQDLVPTIRFILIQNACRT